VPGFIPPPRTPGYLTIVLNLDGIIPANSAGTITIKSAVINALIHIILEQ
jgi:hypothetical protein